MALTMSCYTAPAQSSALALLSLKCLGARFVGCGVTVCLRSNTSFHGADEKTDDGVT